MDKSPYKPNDSLIKLYDFGPIYGIMVANYIVGYPKTEPTLRFFNDKGGFIDLPVKDVEAALIFDRSDGGIARLHVSVSDSVQVWKEFEAGNAEDLATYFRLKEKFRGI